MRTTIDIDDPILRQVKELSKQRGRSLGRVVSDLLSKALESEDRPSAPALEFVVREMKPRYDLDDRDAMLDALDERDEPGEPSEEDDGR